MTDKSPVDIDAAISALSVNRSLLRDSPPRWKPPEIFLSIGTGLPDCLILSNELSGEART